METDIPIDRKDLLSYLDFSRSVSSERLAATFSA